MIKYKNVYQIEEKLHNVVTVNLRTLTTLRFSLCITVMLSVKSLKVNCSVDHKEIYYMLRIMHILIIHEYKIKLFLY